MNRRPRNLGQAGFTLAETLTATVIGLVALSAFLSFNVNQMYTMRNQTNQVDLQTTARSIADLFAREVRRAGGGTNTACTGTVSTGVLVAQSSQVRTRADLNGDGALNGTNEDVTYNFNTSTNTITRTDNGASRTDTLWSGVSLAGTQIRYFDSAGNELSPGSTGLSAAQLLLVRRIRLELALQANVVDPRNTSLQTAQESADVDLRNRYFILPAICAYN